MGSQTRSSPGLASQLVSVAVHGHALPSSLTVSPLTHSRLRSPSPSRPSQQLDGPQPSSHKPSTGGWITRAELTSQSLSAPPDPLQPSSSVQASTGWLTREQLACQSRPQPLADSRSPRSHQLAAPPFGAQRPGNSSPRSHQLPAPPFGAQRACNRNLGSPSRFPTSRSSHSPISSTRSVTVGNRSGLPLPVSALSVHATLQRPVSSAAPTSSRGFGGTLSGPAQPLYPSHTIGGAQPGPGKYSNHQVDYY